MWRISGKVPMESSSPGSLTRLAQMGVKESKKGSATALDIDWKVRRI